LSASLGRTVLSSSPSSSSSSSLHFSAPVCIGYTVNVGHIHHKAKESQEDTLQTGQLRMKGSKGTSLKRKLRKILNAAESIFESEVRKSLRITLNSFYCCHDNTSMIVSLTRSHFSSSLMNSASKKNNCMHRFRNVKMVTLISIYSCLTNAQIIMS